ncbi:helicase associated domain-containing protein [Mycobacterium sp. smrl_JER01]|uniref:helicase associated domain-containing protein n=1 Tax=Mycobacterium sp. smrl_JER01 TaxID=3402633 RepID=UPI003AC21E21
MASKATLVSEAEREQRHDRAESSAELLHSDSYARDMSGASSIFAGVTASALDAQSRDWCTGYTAVVAYVCRHGGPPAAAARNHGFAVGQWLESQHSAQLSGIQRAALMAIPGITLSRSPKSSIRDRSVERNAAWIRVQAWASARLVEGR